MWTDEPEVEVRSQYKRQKHSRACEFCRYRKVSCDAADRPGDRCSMCIAQDMECRYDPTGKMKRPTKKYVEALESRLSKVEDLLQKFQSDSTHTEGDAKNLEDTLKRPNISKRMQQNRAVMKVIYPRGVHPTTDSSEEIDPSDDEGGYALTDVDFKGYTGKSSNFDLVRKVISLKREHNGASTDTEYDTPFAEIHKRFRPDMLAVSGMLSSITPPFKHQDFPAPDAMAELVDMYFVHLNPYLGLLHRPTFEGELESGLHLRDKGFGTVVLLVCATGSAWAYGSRQGRTHQSPGWQWFNKVTTAQYSLLARPRLYDVQACALMAAYVNTTNSPQATLPILSLGIRMAQAVGAHRKKMYSATPTVEQELWKRAFWTLVAMDRLASFGMGRQCITQDEDFDLDPMTECDDEYWSHPDSSLAFQQPPEKPSKVTFCNVFVRLLKIEAFASRTIFTTNKSKLLLGYVGPEWKQRIVADLDSSLNKWLDTIPSHLRWDPDREDEIFLNQSAILYCNFYQLQIFIHRSFIPSPRRPFANANLSLPSMTICVNAARACLRVLEVQHRRSIAAQSGFALYALTPLQMPLFTVGIMLLVYLWAGARDTQATLKDVDVCLRMLNVLSEAGNLEARKLGIVLRVMSPIAQRAHPPTSSSAKNLAQEGPQTIDELVAAAMQQLVLSGFRVADGSEACANPLDSDFMSIITVPAVDEPSEPSPFVRTGPSSTSNRVRAGMARTRENQNENLRAAVRDGPRRAFEPHGHVHPSQETWTHHPDAFGGAFIPTRPSPESSATTQSQFANGPSASPAPAPAPSPESAPTPGNSALHAHDPWHAYGGGGAGPSERGDFDFTFGNALMADDLEFFDSLSSMFGSGSGSAQHPSPSPPPPPPPASASAAPWSASSSFGPPHPHPQTATSFAGGGVDSAAQGYAPGQVPYHHHPHHHHPASAVPSPSSVEVQPGSVGNEGVVQDRRPWQWTAAPRSELWDQWGAYVFNHEGAT